MKPARPWVSPFDIQQGISNNKVVFVHLLPWLLHAPAHRPNINNAIVPVDLPVFRVYLHASRAWNRKTRDAVPRILCHLPSVADVLQDLVQCHCAF